MNISKLRGFNLIELFNETPATPVKEIYFSMIRDWGFNYVRVPINYKSYTNRQNWHDIREEVFISHIDKYVEYSIKHNIHLTFNLHRIPGYCINRRNEEPFDLFDVLYEENRNKALQAAVVHWEYFSKRYKDVDYNQLSFNLVNEPPNFISQRSINIHIEVMQSLFNAATKFNSDRLIIIDGINAGVRHYDPLPNEKKIALSTRGYTPSQLTHYKADFAKIKTDFNGLSWPLFLNDGARWDRNAIKTHYSKWKESKRSVMVGEFGVYNTVPSNITNAYIDDLLTIFNDNKWGWALWNLKGPFGILNNGRHNSKVTKLNDYQVDAGLLDVLMRH